MRQRGLVGGDVCRRATVELQPVPEAALTARRFLEEVCQRWEIDGLRDELLLAVSELVTNGVVHARTPIAVNVSVVTTVIEVGVRDHDRHLPAPRTPRTDLVADLDALTSSDSSLEDGDPRHRSLWVGDSGSVTAGRGLQLLAAITDAWGVTAHAGAHTGKEVWFTLAVPKHWSYTQSCQCQPDGPLHTASGMGIRHLSGPWDGG
jgi:hypothetical protein